MYQKQTVDTSYIKDIPLKTVKLYYLYDNPLRIVNEAKCLGVLLDSKLNFNRHIKTMCKKANGVLAFLKRNLYTV